MTAPLLERILSEAVEAGGPFWSLPGTQCQIGAVLFARHGEAFVAVRKAPKDEYPFSGKLAMPGGMVKRLPQSAGLLDAMRASVVARAHAEAGLAGGDLLGAELIRKVAPVVSKYPVKGVDKYTAVVAWQCSISSHVALSPCDRSVDQARWLAPPLPWDEFSPANCVLIGSILWATMKSQEQEMAMPHIEQALSTCSKWADEAGLPAPQATWR